MSVEGVNEVDAMQAQKEAEEIVERQKLRFKSILNELAMKKEEIIEMRKEIDNIKMQNYDLELKIKSIENERNNLQANCKTLVENKESIENKLKELVAKQSVQERKCDEALLEAKTLRELIKKVQLEKTELLRKVDDLKSINCSIEFYKSQFTEQLSKDVLIFNKIKEEFKSLKEKEEELSLFMNEIKKLKDNLLLAEFYKQKMETLTNQKNHMEQELAFYKGESMQFRELIEKSKFLTSDKQISFLLEKWESSVNMYKTESSSHHIIVNNLLDNLKKERDVNSQLIIREAENTEKIRALENKLIDLRKSVQGDNEAEL